MNSPRPKICSGFMIILILACLLTTPSYGATLFNLYEMAIQQNPQWALFEAQEQQSVLQTQMAQAQLKPQIGLTGSFGFSWQNSNLAQPPSLTENQISELNQCLALNNDYGLCLNQVAATSCEDDPGCLIANNETSSQYQTARLGIQATQAIYKPKTRQLIAQSQHQQSLSFAKSQLQRQAFLNQLVSTYLLALSSTEEVSSQKNAFQTSQNQLNLLEQSFENGQIPASEVLYARALLELKKTELGNAQRQRRDAFRTLESIVQQPLAQLTRINKDTPMPPPTPGNPAQWVDIAKAHSPQLHQLIAQQKIAHAEYNQRKAQLKPEVQLVAGIGMTSVDNPSALNQGDNISGNIQLEFTMPIYSGGALSARVEEAQNLQYQAKLSLSAAEATLEHEIHEAFNRTSQGFYQIEALSKAVKALEIRVEQLKLGFEKGIETASQLLEAQDKLYEVQQKVLLARYDYIRSSVTLKQLAGVLGEKDIVVISSWSDKSATQGPQRTLFDDPNYWLSP